ncbi:hypothetical protein G7Y89_g726 [Cudoniella acicularis]|uniref:Uncharacterized protein n=1 Tax=Cudoniella acicularis TaxID=354080 RepID=A0A8H4RYD6_9HELO|nr:hypothetical protein G7Y89_g726 [Cudoniella acicularis]
MRLSTSIILSFLPIFLAAPILPRQDSSTGPDQALQDEINGASVQGVDAAGTLPTSNNGLGLLVGTVVGLPLVGPLLGSLTSGGASGGSSGSSSGLTGILKRWVGNTKRQSNLAGLGGLGGLVGTATQVLNSVGDLGTVESTVAPLLLGDSGLPLK